MHPTNVKVKSLRCRLALTQTHIVPYSTKNKSAYVQWRSDETLNLFKRLKYINNFQYKRNVVLLHRLLHQGK